MRHCIVIGEGAGTNIRDGEYLIVLGDGAGLHLVDEKLRLVIGSMMDVPITEAQYYEIRAALSGPINIGTGFSN
jgi:hypothetical protein